MSSNVIKTAVAGLGRSGYDIHLACLRQVPRKFRIVAVCDEMADRAAEVAEEFSCHGFTDYKDMLRTTPIDLFVNALPNKMHAAATVKALHHGMHVVCEKPLATRVAEFDRMAAAAAKTGGIFAPFQNGRFTAVYDKMMSILASGALGEVIHARLTRGGFMRRWDWQTQRKHGGGMTANLGAHLLDQALMIFGEGDPQVFARLVSGPNFVGDADDFSAVTLYGPGKPTVEVHLSCYATAPAGPAIAINGTRGGLWSDAGGLRWKFLDPEKLPPLTMDAAWAEDRRYCREKLPWKTRRWSVPDSRRKSGYASRRFYDNIYKAIGGRETLVVTPAQVRRQIRVIELAHRANTSLR